MLFVTDTRPPVPVNTVPVFAQAPIEQSCSSEDCKTRLIRKRTGSPTSSRSQGARSTPAVCCWCLTTQELEEAMTNAAKEADTRNLSYFIDRSRFR